MGKRILIVEDNSQLRETLVTILRHMGYEAVGAQDGYEGVEKSLTEHPDLVLMDLRLPGMDGIEATKRIKEDARTAKIPVVAYTAWPSHLWRNKALAAGAVEYLQKPVTFSLLKDIIDKCLSPEKP